MFFGEGGVDAEMVLDLTKQLGVLAVLAWFLFYTVKYTLPDMQKNHIDAIKELNNQNNTVVDNIVSHHRNTIADLTNRFDDRLKEERQSWLQDLAEERIHRKNEIDKLTEAIRSMSHREA